MKHGTFLVAFPRDPLIFQCLFRHSMTETAVHPNFHAVKHGLIPISPQEQMKLDKDGLDVIHDIHRYAQTGFASIDNSDFDRMKWYGVYRQKPMDSGFFMMRLRLPGGQVTGLQAAKISELADRFGHGFCDVTTRMTIQYHWLTIDTVPTIFAELASVGIETAGACGDIPRNVVGCPVAGIDPEEISDATALVAEADAGVVNNREFSNLPRKYKISMAGCCIHCAQPDINDVGVFGLKRTVNGSEERGYGMMIGGGLSSSPHLAQRLPYFLRPEQVWPVTRAVTEYFRDEGYRLKRNRARFKFLVADVVKAGGIEALVAQVEQRLGFQPERHTDFAQIKDQETDHIGVHKQRQGDLYWVGICFPGGRMRQGQLALIGNLAAKYCAPGQDAIRLTNKQNVLIVNVPEANLPALKAELDTAGLDYNPGNFRKGCVSCTGIEFCNLAVAETKNRMIALVEELEAQSGWYKDKIRIHFSGCPSSCGQHQIADIGFRGARTKVNGEMIDAYDCFIGGRLGNNRRFNELLKGKIIAKDVHLFIDRLLRTFTRLKTGEETFADFCDRVPREQVLAELEKTV